MNPRDERVLRERLRLLLLSPPVQRVDFTWRGLRVSGRGYAYIALALESAPSGQRGISLDVGRLGHGVAANYSSSKNRLTVGSPGNGLLHKERVLLVHEMTHAVIDEFGPGGGTRGIEHEICAYSAAALFNVYSSPSLSGPFHWAPQPWSAAVWVQAHTLAVRIASRPGVALSEADAQSLRRAIVAAYGATYGRRIVANSGVGL